MTEEKREPGARRVLTIEPEKLHEGTCRIQKSDGGDERFVICKEGGKIKIFELEEEE